jgi:hypothetical protein
LSEYDRLCGVQGLSGSGSAAPVAERMEVAG